MSDLRTPTAQPASSAELSSLCEYCGLCCDGTLFGRVDLGAEEVAGARGRRLRIVPGGRSFEQPCSALDVAGRHPGGRRSCTIYEERPLSCRRFVCRLYEKYRCEGGSIEEALSVVRRARSLLASLSRTGSGVTELTRIIDENFTRA
jgi:Fe-S-cluster containining protein